MEQQSEEERLRHIIDEATKRAMAEVDLSKVNFQWLKLIEGNDKIRAGIVAVLRKSSGGEYANEEIESSMYRYPWDYQLRSIADQVAHLQKLFPELGGFDEEFANNILPLGAEGWFAIPRWQTISETYKDAVKRVFIHINQDRGGQFLNLIERNICHNSLQQDHHALAMIRKLGYQQRGHDILIVPAQFGLRHWGRSARRARETFKYNEFGLGVFAVGVMLLTHPKRLESSYNNLWVNCFDKIGDDSSPYFSFLSNRVIVDIFKTDNASEKYGHVTGFLPF